MHQTRKHVYMSRHTFREDALELFHFLAVSLSLSVHARILICVCNKQSASVLPCHCLDDLSAQRPLLIHWSGDTLVRTVGFIQLNSLFRTSLYVISCRIHYHIHQLSFVYMQLTTIVLITQHFSDIQENNKGNNMTQKLILTNCYE